MCDDRLGGRRRVSRVREAGMDGTGRPATWVVGSRHVAYGAPREPLARLLLLLLLTAVATAIGWRGCGSGRSQNDADQHITSSIAYRRR